MIHSEDGKSIQQTIEGKYAGISLEQYLRKEMLFTKAQIRSMKFRENGLMINGERVRINYILKENDLLCIQLEEAERSSDQLEETEGELEILYEDDDLIVIWKEAGIVVHPSHGHYKDTLSNRIYAYYKKQQKNVMVRSIGRLDRDTSGILVFAKNQVAAARLWKQKEEGIFWKEYLAVCKGKIELPVEDNWYTIRANIDAMPGELMKMCVSPTGKEAVTHIQIAGYDTEADTTLVRVRIDTGRTHQIRVHMAHIGHPLVGDPLYSGSQKMDQDLSGNRMFLCAWKAEFLQPFTNEVIVCQKNKTEY